MDPFIVNLMDPVQLCHLKGTIHLENSQEKMNEEFEKKLPHLIDNILTILSSKTYRGIIKSDGKKTLREEIKGKMNELLTDFKVHNDYFTEFIIQ
jgi:flagellar basal body-associated protein FliL